VCIVCVILTHYSQQNINLKPYEVKKWQIILKTYLQQHADNPVDWYPWGEKAFKKALKEHKPIFLSIGYSSCHWCHVMEHESFVDEKTAKILNENFISIKVDREERPKILNPFTLQPTSLMNQNMG